MAVSSGYLTTVLVTTNDAPATKPEMVSSRTSRLDDLSLVADNGSVEANDKGDDSKDRCSDGGPLGVEEADADEDAPAMATIPLREARNEDREIGGLFTSSSSPTSMLARFFTAVGAQTVAARLDSSGRKASTDE